MLRHPRLTIPYAWSALLDAACTRGAGVESTLATALGAWLACRDVWLFRNGRYALWQALSTLEGTGREVLVPAYGCPIVPHVVLAAGHVPRLVDIDPRGFHLAPDALGRALGPHTAAVIVVHEFGYPAPASLVAEIRRRSQARVIEDAAIALGARHADGTPVGRLGDAVIVSGSLGKPVSAGDFGALAWRTGAPPVPAPARRPPGVTRECRAFLRLAAARIAAAPPVFALLAPWLDALSRADAAGLDPARRFVAPTRLDCVLMHRLVAELDVVRTRRAERADPVLRVLAEAGWTTFADGPQPMYQRIPFHVPAALDRDTVRRALVARGVDATVPGRVDLGAIPGVRNDPCPHAREAFRRVLSVTLDPAKDGADLARRLREGIAACTR